MLTWADEPCEVDGVLDAPGDGGQIVGVDGIAHGDSRWRRR